MASVVAGRPAGLVLCPKTRTTRFPTPELLGSAAAGIAGASRAGKWDGSEGPRWFVTVSPGSVRVSSTDLARGQRRDNRRVEYLVENWERPDLAHGVPAHPSMTREYFLKEMSDAAIDVLVDGGLLGEESRPLPLAPGRRIVEWSRKSRTNMVRRLVTLDYAPLVEQGPLALLTLTYPGEWESVCPDGGAFKRHIDLFRQRYRKRWGRPLTCVWKMEFQERGAPHWHALFAPPAGREFRDWLSATWADVVAHPDPIQRMRHERAGTAVDFRDGLRMTDPKRVAVYFTKHGLLAGKEYQNSPPKLWLDSAVSVGRFWGVWGLKPAEVPVMITGDEARDVVRTLRRWDAASRGTRKAIVWRQTVDRRTGEVRWRKRKVRRRIRRMSGRAGFLSVNDGTLAAWLIERVIESRGT